MRLIVSRAFKSACFHSERHIVMGNVHSQPLAVGLTEGRLMTFETSGLDGQATITNRKFPLSGVLSNLTSS